MGCHVLLPGIFPTQGWDQADSLPPEPPTTCDEKSPYLWVILRLFTEAVGDPKAIY